MRQSMLDKELKESYKCMYIEVQKWVSSSVSC